MSNNDNNASRALMQPIIADHHAVQPWTSLGKNETGVTFNGFNKQMAEAASTSDFMAAAKVNKESWQASLERTAKEAGIGLPPAERFRLAEKKFLDALEAGWDVTALRKLSQARDEWERWLKRYTREKRDPLKLELASAIAMEPPPIWAVVGIIPDSGIGTFYGPPKSFKSFLATDLLAHLAEGLPWFGRAAMKRQCVYIPFEGHAGLPSRIRAWEQYNQRPAPFHVMRKPFNLRDQQGRDELVELLKPLERPVLCIDTLAAAAGSFDENSMKDMGAMIAILQELQERLDGLVTAVHHTGKDKSQGMRGHSSLSGAVDFALECTRGPGNAAGFKIALAKDSEQGTAFAFEMEAVGNSMVVAHRSESAAYSTAAPDIALTTVAARIQERGPLSQRELLEQRGLIPEAKIYAAVKTLKEQGKVEVIGGGPHQKLRWSLPLQATAAL